VRRRELRLTAWGAVHRELGIGAGPEAYLVVRENANPGWVATLDGRPLRAARVDGWQQAWVLPASGPGTVTLDFRPDRPYRAGLLLGALAVLLLVLAAVLPPRRPAAVTAAVRAGTGGAWRAGLLVLLVGLLGGLPALAAAGGFLLLHRFWGNAAPAAILAAGTVATGIAVAGRLAGHGQAWALGGPVQAATLLAIAALVGAVLRPPPDRYGARLFLD
jgi:arabinofuranan 3-O-arabinosyltransferase